MKKSSPLLLASALTLLAATASADPIYANSPTGDTVIGVGTSGLAAPVAGSPGWYYNNVRQGATAGIDGTYAYNGNASYHMTGTTSTSKADLEYYSLNTPGVFASGYKALGTLGTLSAFSYSYYRASSSTVAGHLAPALRFMYDADGNFGTTNDRGFLVFEPVYNGNPTTGPAVPTDQWINADVFNFSGAGQSANVWMTNTGNANGTVEAVYNRTLQDWLTTPNPNSAYPTLSASTAIFGLSMGSGSGWSGTFDGAVDNVTLGFNGVSNTFNFEVQAAPEPAPMAALALGALGLLRRRSRRA